MATLVLGAVGSAIGAGFGGTILGFSGAAIGGFIGSSAGSLVDSWIVSSLAPAQRIEGARLDSLRITSSTEGAVIPRLYGRMRLGGNIIWATDFREETRTTSQGGGKGGGGPKVTTTEYLYFASFAVALCEGPITGIGRVWADGKALDMTGITWRWYSGDELQTPDPFISAKMGAASTPAYRGTAYVVLEELELTPFGNRLPQISFEVFRPLADPDTAEGLVRAVTMIPASGEFAYATDGVWMRLVPRPGWLAWIAAEQTFVVWNGSSWELVGEPVDVSDAVFSLVNDADPTKKALFSLSGITTGTTRTFTLPNTSSELAILAGTQTFSGNKTFSGSLTASGAVSITGTLTASGTVTVSAAAASIGTAITAATYGMGRGVNPTGVTKTLNLGTGGAAGSTTVVNIGSATAGAGGTTVVNTPTVTFANAVTQVGMPQANLTAQLLGLGGATADSFNRLSMNTPAVLLNNAGAGIEATVNKAAVGNDAAFAFKTGFSARALVGLLGNDNFSFKVSPNGSTFFDAIVVDRTNGQVELSQPTVLPGLNAAPTPPPSGKTSVYARNRAGAPWIDVMRPSGRDFPLQPHFGVNRIANWSPSITTTITTEGLPITNVGTVSHPTLAATNLAASMRRWRLTSAAVVDSVAEQRSAGWACWRGNAAGLGGWTFVTRLSLTTLQATGMGFFGLYGSIAALAVNLTLAAVINAVGIGFQRGTHANWQLVTNDGTGAPTLTDMGAPFAIALGGVQTLFIAAPPNGSSVWVRAVNEVSGAVFEQEITADLPANTQFLSPRLYLNNGATAAAVAYDCAGLYLETDY